MWIYSFEEWIEVRIIGRLRVRGNFKKKDDSLRYFYQKTYLFLQKLIFLID